MKKPEFIDRNSTLRSWSRRFVFGLRNRPDVQLLQLQRKIEVLEGFTGIAANSPGWIDAFTGALTPVQFSEVPLARLGSEFDGGYVLPIDLIKDLAGVVSVGVGDNNEVDIDLANLGLRVHAWDHTVKNLPTTHKNISFHKVGLGHHSADSSLKTLTEMVESCFPGDDTDLLLMLDAEGAEWQALADCTDEVLNRFGVIAIELHDLGNMILNPDLQLSVLRKLNSMFVPIAIHANNHSALWKIPGLDLPDAIEVTYLNRSFMHHDGETGNCPSELNSPCCPDLGEMQISWTDR